MTSTKTTDRPRRTATNLADRSQPLSVSQCKFCGGDVAWATGKSGKRYPCEVTPRIDRDGDTTMALNARPWQPHNCRDEAAKRQASEIDHDQDTANQIHKVWLRMHDDPDPFKREIADELIGKVSE